MNNMYLLKAVSFLIAEVIPSFKKRERKTEHSIISIRIGECSKSFHVWLTNRNNRITTTLKNKNLGVEVKFRFLEEEDKEA